MMALGDRKEFDEATKAAIYAEQKCCCAECGKPTPRSKGRFDHEIPDAFGGVNNKANCRFTCNDCDAPKTAADQTAIAKMKRRVIEANAHNDFMAAKEPGQRRPRKGTIPGRGFSKEKRSMAKKELPAKLREPKPVLPPRPLFRDMTKDEIAARDSEVPEPARRPARVVERKVNPIRRAKA